MSESPAPTPLLEVRDLAVSFSSGIGPRIQAVDGVSMSIFPGQTLAVVGESGSGKSVTALATLRLLAMPPAKIDRGEVLFHREKTAISHAGPERATRAKVRVERGAPTNLLALPESQVRQVRGGEIAMIFQEPMTSLNPVFSVGDQIIEAIQLHQGSGKLSKQDARAKAIDAMTAVGIHEPAKRIDQFPHQFSGGMRQRIMIAMALACEPSLLLADEPTTALDVTVQAQVLDLISQIKQYRHMGVMLITHDLGIVKQRADVVCVMYAGRVVEYARAKDLFEQPLHPYTRALLACAPRLGQRRDRLATVRETVDQSPEFQRSGDQPRPWWLWHDPPPGTATENPCALLEAKPGHWIGVWNNLAVTMSSAGVPKIQLTQ
ncbi:MAG: ABC transporter ATP-binding protein [Phycisphaerales bacterium]